jgi:homoserine dehydrogenase
MKPLGIGLLGCGTVGSGLVELLERSRDHLERRTGLSPRLARVLVRDAHKPRAVDRALVTDDPEAFFGSEGLDVVVELIGGVEPARTYVLRALDAGHSVVTANKALLSVHADEIFRRAHRAGVSVGFEASVCGAIPIVRALCGGLIANRISSLVGIVNGTCNFVLTRMIEDGLTLTAALEEARRRGLTEADPSLDLDGTDAMQKLLILASLAFGVHPDPARVRVRGIRELEPEDIRAALEFGCTVRHVASADGAELRVEPAFLPRAHPLAGVRDENNAILVHGDAAGQMIFSGKGAGPLPTAGAVLSDIVEVAARPGPMFVPANGQAPPAPAESRAPHYLRLPIVDRPGMIGLIGTVLGNHGISITRVSASLTTEPGRGNVKILVDAVDESTLSRALEQIARLPVLTGKPVVVRILA